MEGEVVQVKERAVAQPLDMQALMQRALDNGADGVSALERLVSLQERILDRQAAQDYARAVAEFQAACPVIDHNKTVQVVSKKTGARYSYSYAELDHIAKRIRPILERHGLSYSFDSEIVEGQVRAVCIVRHLSGYSERTTFQAPIDQSAQMSDPQKVASALSYARRYALILALGLTTGEPDDDGVAAGSKTITASQVADLHSLISEVGADEAKYLKLLGVQALGDIPASSYNTAVSLLEARRKTS